MKWKAIPGWEGMYEVSTGGLVRSVDRVVPIRTRANGRKGSQRWEGKVLASRAAKNGYPMVILSRGAGRGAHSYVHQLVLLAFVGPCPEGLEVCHNNGRRTDNRLENLRYDTRSANAMDRHAHGTFNPRRGEDCPSAKLCERDVRWVRENVGGMSQRAMARVLGVGHRTVGAVIRGESWKHIA